ncbi:MAG: SLC13 family permease [Acidimicrobiales bacterium]
MEVLAVGLLVVGVAGAVARPWGLGSWVVPTAAAILVGITPLSGIVRSEHSLRPLAGPVAFLLAAVPLAVLLDRLGFFEALAHLFTGGARLEVGLWALAAGVTTVLNLDASVVLLTPLYIRIARREGSDPRALAAQPVILALLASSALPVSNLTNLIAAARTGAGPGQFVAHLALPSLTATMAGYWFYRRAIRGGVLSLGNAAGSPSGHRPKHKAPRDQGRGPLPDDRATRMDIASDAPAAVAVPRANSRALLVGAVVVSLVLVGFVLGPSVGLEPWAVALMADVVLVGFTRSVPVGAIPWGTALVAGSLAVLAGAAAARLSLHSLLEGHGVGFTLVVGGTAAVAANVVNNLPALLVALAGSPHHSSSALWALLLGVNMGPSILVTGSLASLLWLESTQRLGVAFSARDYARVGARVGLPALVVGLAVLVLLQLAGL